MSNAPGKTGGNREIAQGGFNAGLEHYQQELDTIEQENRRRYEEALATASNEPGGVSNVRVEVS
jgi:hypothetical protein